MLTYLPAVSEKARVFLIYFASLGLIGMLCFHLVGYVASLGAYLLVSLPEDASALSRVDRYFLTQAKQRNQGRAPARSPVLAMGEPAFPANVLAAQIDSVERSRVDVCDTNETDCANGAIDLSLSDQTTTYGNFQDRRRVGEVRPRNRPAARLRPAGVGYH
jgi:hypothetical protein